MVDWGAELGWGVSKLIIRLNYEQLVLSVFIQVWGVVMIGMI